MRRMFVLLLILVISGLSLAETEKKEEKEKKKKPNKHQIYLDYKKDKNFDSFNKAMSVYQERIGQDADDYNSNVMVSFLCLMEMNRMMEVLKTNFDSLTNRQKFNYANLLLSLNEYDKSIAAYEKINEATPKWSCAWRHKGEACYKKGDYDNAEKALLKAIETRKTHYDAYIWLATVRKDMGKNKEALESFNTGLSYKFKDIEDPEEEILPEDELFLHLELLELNGQADTDKYKAVLKKLKEIAPDDERLKG